MPTPKPSPSPSPAPCQISSATWSRGVAIEGDIVNLHVAGNSSCNGKVVNFAVKENDSVAEGLGDDNVNVNPQSAAFLETNATAKWKAEFQNDCSGLCNPPEYYFTAALGDNASVNVKSGGSLLEVIKAGSTAPPPTSAQTLTLTPTDDAFINKDSPKDNYGSNTQLKVDNVPVKRALLKFSTKEIGTRQVAGAKLRVYATDPSDVGGILQKMTDSDWSEKTITWYNAPEENQTEIGSLGKVSSGKWYEVDVTSAIGGGEISFEWKSTSRDGVNYASKEYKDGSFAPQLVITFK